MEIFELEVLKNISLAGLMLMLSDLKKMKEGLTGDSLELVDCNIQSCQAAIMAKELETFEDVVLDLPLWLN